MCHQIRRTSNRFSAGRYSPNLQNCGQRSTATELATLNYNYTEASLENASRIVLFCSWLACLHTRASVACSSLSKSTKACFLPLDSKIFALITVPWADRWFVMSSTAISDGRLDT